MADLNQEVGIGQPKNEKTETETTTRSKLSLVFILGFFGILFMCFVFVYVSPNNAAILKDLLVGVVGALSGLIGFIIGFYFKSNQKGNDAL